MKQQYMETQHELELMGTDATQVWVEYDERRRELSYQRLVSRQHRRQNLIAELKSRLNDFRRNSHAPRPHQVGRNDDKHDGEDMVDTYDPTVPPVAGSPVSPLMEDTQIDPPSPLLLSPATGGTRRHVDNVDSDLVVVDGDDVVGEHDRTVLDDAVTPEKASKRFKVALVDGPSAPIELSSPSPAKA